MSETTLKLVTICLNTVYYYKLIKTNIFSMACFTIRCQLFTSGFEEQMKSYDGRQHATLSLKSSAAIILEENVICEITRRLQMKVTAFIKIVVKIIQSV